MNIPVAIHSGTLPLNFEAIPVDLFEAIRLRLRGVLRSDSILTGHVGSGAPYSNVGPWFDGRKWNFWLTPSARYVPEVRKLDGPDADIAATLTSDPTDQRYQFLQDKSGDILFLNDIYVPRALNILNATPLTIDWGLTSDFLCRLTADATFFMIQSKEGQEICVYVQNIATSYNVTWPDYIMWPNGIPPAQPSSRAGQSVMAEYNFININGIIYGELASSIIHSNPANTVFLGGSDTATGREPGGGTGYHTTSGALNVRIQ